ARITRVALQHLRGPRSENVEVGQTRARHEMVRLERGLIILEIIVGIAPLLGLIGAVSGLLHVFSHLGLSSGGGGSEPRQIALVIIIVSLVSILIILLIFFVVSTTFKKDQPEVQINLPESKSAQNRPSELEHAIVSIDQNDEV